MATIEAEVADRDIWTGRFLGIPIPSFPAPPGVLVQTLLQSSGDLLYRAKREKIHTLPEG
ncbi:hypothetical protein [Streptomyces sp. 3213.3]|uniref:hypothetical protein n=1 Tax=Streptomyces sp. 3213.3 TaxID=1855348 RepID=UPI001042708E|nr:hypothetical protein [Streptomyces sp. 3213.3]